MAESVAAPSFAQFAVPPPEDQKKELSVEDVLLLTKFGPETQERLVATFNTQPVLNEKKTRESGRPIFDDVEYIRIMIPKDPGNVPHRPVTWCGSKTACRARDNEAACDLHRFGRQYAAWKGSLIHGTASGRPLSTWPMMTTALIEEMKYFRIYTVQDMAAMPDALASQLGKGYEQLRQQARDFLESAEGNAPTVRLRDELTESRAQLSALQAAVELQTKVIDELKRNQSAPIGAPPAPAIAAPERSAAKSGR